MWGQSLKPGSDAESKERIKLLTHENAELRAELARSRTGSATSSGSSPTAAIASATRSKRCATTKEKCNEFLDRHRHHRRDHRGRRGVQKQHRAKNGIALDWMGGEKPIERNDPAQQREIEELRERIKVLERIATEDRETKALSAEIESLREK
jgi:cell division protein FtsB